MAALMLYALIATAHAETVVADDYDNDTGFGTSHSLVFGAAYTNGNSAVCAIRSAQVPTLTGIWAGASTLISSAGTSTPILYVYLMTGITGSPTSFTYTVPSSTATQAGCIEVSGTIAEIAGTCDKVTTTSAASITNTTTADAAGNLIFGFGDINNSVTGLTPNSGYTLLGTAGGWTSMVYLASTSGSGAQTPGWSHTENRGAALIACAFETASAGGSVGAGLLDGKTLSPLRIVR